MQRDPINIHKERLLSQNIATQAEVDQIDTETQQQDRRRHAGSPERVPTRRPRKPYCVDMFANPIPLE